MKDRRDDDAEWADLVARLEAMDPGVTDAEAQAQRKAEELEDFFASQPFYPITKADADSTAEPPPNLAPLFILPAPVLTLQVRGIGLR
ncbi:hypothetical protein [Pseudoglutamicibacter albus]|uniref:hypothetical protein n=1 Tax=Pseudoglutamicibacter albus TaxID=98671 RepID=UPI0036103C33